MFKISFDCDLIGKKYFFLSDIVCFKPSNGRFITIKQFVPPTPNDRIPAYCLSLLHSTTSVLTFKEDEAQSKSLLGLIKLI